MSTSPIPAIVSLADAQLRAYNDRDIDAFCACFAEDVRVVDESGAVTLAGLETFRVRYGELFAGHPVMGARIIGRLCLPPHLVELEVWFRQTGPEAPLQQGEVIVRYTERAGRIALVEFLKPA